LAYQPDLVRLDLLLFHDAAKVTINKLLDQVRAVRGCN
jgi:hypothetical protein